MVLRRRCSLFPEPLNRTRSPSTSTTAPNTWSRHSLHSRRASPRSTPTTGTPLTNSSISGTTATSPPLFSTERLSTKSKPSVTACHASRHGSGSTTKPDHAPPGQRRTKLQLAAAPTTTSRAPGAAPAIICSSCTPAAPPACRRVSCGAKTTCSACSTQTTASGFPPSRTSTLSKLAPPEPGPRNMPGAPLMHGTGLFNAISNLMVGGSITTTVGRSFSAEEFLDTVEHYGINSSSIVGDAFAKPILKALDAEPNRWDISSLRVIVSSGVMWSKETKDGLLRHNDRLIMVDALGSSEAIGMATNTTTSDSVSDPNRQTAQFELGPNTRVITDDGNDVVPGSGERGRVALRGRTPIGYYKDEAKSAETFVIIGGERYSIPGDYATVESRRHRRPPRARQPVHQHRWREGLPRRSRRVPQATSRRCRRSSGGPARREVGRVDHCADRDAPRRLRRITRAARSRQGQPRGVQGPERSSSKSTRSGVPTTANSTTAPSSSARSTSPPSSCAAGGAAWPLFPEC